MKIRAKLLLGFVLKAILILFLIAGGWFQLSTISRISDDLQQNFSSLSLSHSIQRQIKDEAIHLRSIMFFSDKNLLQQELKSLQEARDSVMQHILSLESMVKDAEQRLVVEDLKSMNQKFNNYIGEATQLAAAGNKDEAIHIVMNQGQQMQTEYFQVISKINDGFEGEMNSSLDVMSNDLQRKMLLGSLLSLLGIVVVIGYVSRNVWAIAVRLKKVSDVMLKVANGNEDLKTRIEAGSNDEIDHVARSFNHMAESLEEQINKEQNTSKINREQAWIKSNIAEITTELSGMHELESISQIFLSRVVPLVEACQAAFYLKDGEQSELSYKLFASYAFKERKHPVNRFSLGEGLVGQAALEKTPILLTDVPADYIRVRSGLGEAAPLNIYVLPVSYKGDVSAVIEIASFIRFTAAQQSLLDELIRSLGILLDSAIGRIQLAKLLEESQAMTEELQVQSEELQSQQEELRAANEELESQTQALRQSEERLQYQQEELEQTNSELREKAEILESQYKKLEITNEEVELARAELEEKAKELTLSSKYKSEFLANMSHELRTPLNSLLILSKLLADNGEGNLSEKQVEFARTVYLSGCDLLTIINDILDLAKIESGKFEVHPSKVYVKDLISFTKKSFGPVASEKNIEFNITSKRGCPRFIYSDEQRLQQVLKNLLSNAFKFTDQGKVTLEIGAVNELASPYKIYFSISDTGIGIPKEKQELIFEAFQQADGTTSRKFGGTGLGLSICRQISSLLGAEITVQSEEGKGSTFTFYVDDFQEERTNDIDPIVDEVAVSIEAVSDADETSIEVDDGAHMKRSLLPLYEKNSHIKRLLIVDDDLNQRNSLMELIGDKDVIITAVSTGNEAIEELKVSQFDCMLLDLGLSDTTGFELLKEMKSNNLSENTKIFIYTGRDLTPKEELYLKRHAHSIIIKDSHSPQRLLDELELFLNAGGEQSIHDKADYSQDKIVNGLEGKKVLLVDDDVRNVFALSNVLEMHGMIVRFAENGIEGLKVLNQYSDFDVVLMDIMMPEMDGYETIKRLREIPQFQDLPVIALTAKAMKEDREKCIEAGASDYIVKPVSTDQLISLIRVWLYPGEAK